MNSKRPVRIRLREENLKNLKRQIDQLVEKCGEDAKVLLECCPDTNRYYLEVTPK